MARLEVESMDAYISGYSPDKTDQALEEMQVAYEVMATGITEDVSKAASDSLQMPKVETKPLYYSSIDGPHGSRTQFLVFPRDSYYGRQPDYIDAYHQARSRAYKTLLNGAIQSQDLSLMLPVLVETNDPHMPRRFLSSISRKQEDYPDWTNASGTARIHARIDERNRLSSGLQRAVRAHAKRQRNAEREDDKTLRATLASKLGSLGLKKYIEVELLEPVRQAASQPMIEEQLLQEAKERAGLSRPRA